MLSEHDMRAVFSLFDKDKSGSISCVELGTVMRSLGQIPTQKELQQMISEVDTNGTGTVEFNEFVQLMQRHEQEHDPEADLKAAFAIYDKDGSGYLSAAELQAIILGRGDKMTAEEAEEMLREADINGDGLIDYREFAKVMLGT